MRRFRFLECQQYNLKGRLDRHGPAALAFDEFEGGRIGFAFALCLARFSLRLGLTRFSTFTGYGRIYCFGV
jgi:hypothetical protein